MATTPSQATIIAIHTYRPINNPTRKNPRIPPEYRTTTANNKDNPDHLPIIQTLIMVPLP